MFKLKHTQSNNPSHTHIHTPAAITLSLLVRAQVNGKHVLVLRELFPALLSSPSSSSAGFGPSLPPPLPPLLGHPAITLLRPQALDRKWAAGDGVCVMRERVAWKSMKKHTHTHTHTHYHKLSTKGLFFIRAYHGDENCPCPAGTPLTAPPLTWWVMLQGRVGLFPVNRGTWHGVIVPLV